MIWSSNNSKSTLQAYLGSHFHAVVYVAAEGRLGKWLTDALPGYSRALISSFVYLHLSYFFFSCDFKVKDLGKASELAWIVAETKIV